MKRLFLLILAVSISFNITAQTQAWLPEKFVTAVSKHDTTAYQYLIPVEGFITYNNGAFDILTFMGEINPIKYKKILNNGREKYQLYNLYSYINMKYVSKEWVGRLGKATVYFSKTNGKLLLEIMEKGHKEDIYFVNKHEDYKFNDIENSEGYLMTRYNVRYKIQSIM